MEGDTERGTWRRGARIVAVESPWVRLVCERWRDDHGADLDYWRVEHDHSVIVMPIWRGQVLLPHPMFRPGVDRATLDLPGGRLASGRAPAEDAPRLLAKELGIGPAHVRALRPAWERPLVVNSSFSDQLVYGFVADIDGAAEVDQARVGVAAPATVAGVAGLARDIECLQCRALLQSWLLGQLGA